jgi:hypothetical protein
MDRPVSVPVTTVTAPESITTAPESTKSRSDLKISSSVSIDDDLSSSNERDNGTLRPPEDRTLKKKPSRFRINALPFFRRHKAIGTQASATDAAG